MSDIETGEIHDSCKQNIIDCTRVIDALDPYDVCMETVVSQDVPVAVAPLIL